MANKQLTRDYIMTYVSDLYKDVYGSRPRCYNFKEFKLAELRTFWEELIEQLKKNDIEEAEAKVEAEKDMESTIKYLLHTGANSRATALRWLITGYCTDYLNDNSYITGYDIDGYLYSRGLSLYNDYGKGLRNELLTIAQQLYKQHEKEKV